VQRHLGGTEARIEELRATLDGRAAAARAAKAASASGGGGGGGGACGGDAGDGGGGGRAGRAGKGARAQERARAREAALAASAGRGCGSADVWRMGDDSDGGGGDDDNDGREPGVAAAGWASDGALAPRRGAARWEGVQRYVAAAGAHWRAHDRAAERYKAVPRPLGWWGASAAAPRGRAGGWAVLEGSAVGARRSETAFATRS
jgi:hypothetical protein